MAWFIRRSADRIHRILKNNPAVLLYCRVKNICGLIIRIALTQEEQSDNLTSVV